MNAPDPEIELDCLEERAALIEDGERCGRYIAELTAAQQYGFTNFVTARSSLMKRIKAKKQQ